MSIEYVETVRRGRIYRYLVEIQKGMATKIQYDLVLGKDIDVNDFRNFERNIIYEPHIYCQKYSNYQINTFFKIIDNNKLKCEYSKINRCIKTCMDFPRNECLEYDQEIKLNNLHLLPKELTTIVMLFL
jgi:hypothetical protein